MSDIVFSTDSTVVLPIFPVRFGWHAHPYFLIDVVSTVLADGSPIQFRKAEAS